MRLWKLKSFDFLGDEVNGRDGEGGGLGSAVHSKPAFFYFKYCTLSLNRTRTRKVDLS